MFSKRTRRCCERYGYFKSYFLSEDRFNFKKGDGGFRMKYRGVGSKSETSSSCVEETHEEIRENWVLRKTGSTVTEETFHIRGAGH